MDRSPGIYLTAEENLGKPQPETVDEGCATSLRLNWGPLPPNDVGSNAQDIRRESGEKERMWKGRTSQDFGPIFKSLM